jgi:hypothetical protein
MNNSYIDREVIAAIATHAGFKVDDENIVQFITFYMLCKGQMFSEIQPIFADFMEFAKGLRATDDAVKAINKFTQ